MSRNRPSIPPPAEQPEPDGEVRAPSLLDRLNGIWSHFDRFGVDLLGLALLAVGLLTLLGLLGLSQGGLISPWIRLLQRGFGWGAYLIPFVSGWIGIWIIRQRADQPLRFPLGQALALEGVYFVLLGLWSLFNGHDLDRAEAGLDGGIVGWGIGEIFDLIVPPPWGTLVLVLLLLVFVSFGSGLARWFYHKLEASLEAAPAAPPAPPATTSPAQPEPVEEEPALPVQTRRDEHLPPLNLLLNAHTAPPDQAEIRATAQQIQTTLSDFGIPGRVVGYRIGPTITQFALEPGYVEREGPDGELMKQKVRVSQVSALARDLALALSAERLRIQAPVPGQSYIGIEVPNIRSSVVRLRPILEDDVFQRLQSPLSIALGQGVSGEPVVADLARMPHLLIAGTTGSGKSVCIAALTTCLVMNNTPADLRLVMMDPKMVELARFNGLPHLLGKVETDVDRMTGVLRWALQEMDTRYKIFEIEKVRNLEIYNRKMQRKKQPGLPRIVILIDELADLMMHAPEPVESSLIRLAQLARATGIHLVVATQRPSVEVITGLIKANFPARISFSVASSIDSRVILDTNGAEALLGKGDMLFLNPEVGAPTRLQGALVTDAEVQHVLNFWQKMAPAPAGDAPWEELIGLEDGDSDALVKEATALVRKMQRASASLLQRRLHIGYPRAARLLDQLEAAGVVGPSQGSGRDREVLLDPDEDGEDGEDETYEQNSPGLGGAV